MESDIIENREPEVCECSIDEEWDDIQAHFGTSLAHEYYWFHIIQNAYHHNPLYLKAKDSSQNVAILPSYIVNTPFNGLVVTSMPFLDGGGPSIASRQLQVLLVDKLLEKARRIGAKYVEIRSSNDLQLPYTADLQKVNLALPLLSDDAEALWKQLDAKVRNQVRKAIKSGLCVQFGGIKKLDEFYRVFAINMRDLGSPVHSYRFFEEIFNSFRENAYVALVFKDSRPIGGLIALRYIDTLVVPWASSLRDYFKFCPNMLLYWETIKKACELECKKFDFGRSTKNAGTYHFKKQWGAVEEQLYWYSIPIRANPVKKLSSTDSIVKVLISVWKCLPLSVSLWLGPKIRKYLIQ